MDEGDSAMPQGVAIGFGLIAGAGFATTISGVTTFGIIMGALQGAAIASSLATLLNPPKAKQLQSPAYEFSPDRNTIASGLPIPIVYGKNKIWGNIFRQNILNEGLQMQVWIGLGEGPIQDISELRINNKLLECLTEVMSVAAWDIANRCIKVDTAHGAYGAEYNFWRGAKVTILGGPDWGKTMLVLHSHRSDYNPDHVISVDLHVNRSINSEPVYVLVEKFIYQLNLGNGYGITNDTGDSYYSQYKQIANLHLEVSPSEYIQSSLIEVSCVTKGLQVFIPANWPSSGYLDRVGYSNNPAWCIYDFLTNIRYGVGLPASQLNLSSFKEAATYYDEIITDSQESRYTCNYIIDAQKPGMDHLIVMLGACNSLLIDIDGEYYLKPQKASDSDSGNIAQVFTRDNYKKLIYYPEGSDRRVNQIKAKFTEASYIFDNQTGLNPQAIGAQTITLHTSANTTDDRYNGTVIEILSGPGAGQIRDIVDYTGSTKVAKVDKNWKILPTTASTYQIRKGDFEIVSVVVDDEIAQDEDGEIITQELDLLPCNTVSQAGRIAQMHLDGVRLGNGFCQFRAGLNCVHCLPGDVVEINSSRYGWGVGCTQQATCGNSACTGTYLECVETYTATQYYQGIGLLFRILSINEIQKGRELDIIAKREHPSIYHDYSSGRQESESYAFPNVLAEPDPVTGLTVSDVGSREPDGKWRRAIEVSFVPPDDPFYKEAAISISYDSYGYAYEEVARTSDLAITVYPKREVASYFIMVQTINKFGIKCQSSNSPTAQIVLVCPPIDVKDASGNVTISEGHIINSTNIIMDGLDSLKSLSPPVNFLEYACPGTRGGQPSIFFDFNSNNKGLYVAHIRPYTVGAIYINNTEIYPATGNWNSVSMHSTRNGKVYLVMTNTSHNLFIGEVNATTSPWTIGTPLEILSGSNGYYYPQICMKTDTTFFCVVNKNFSQLIFFLANISGTVLSTVWTIAYGAYGSDLIYDGTNVYISYWVSLGGGVYQVKMRKTDNVPNVPGTSVDLFTIPDHDTWIGNYPHIEKIGNGLYFLFAVPEVSSTGTDNLIKMAKTDLDGNLLVSPYPRYSLLEGYNMEADSCHGVDLFVGRLGETSDESIQIAWMQDQFHIGVGTYEHIYRHRLQKISLSNPNLINLHSNLI